MASGTVRILGRDFAVSTDIAEGLSGLCEKELAVIYVKLEQDRFGLKDTLLHEVMHGILHQQGYDRSYKLEESFVRPLATGLITVLQDNPELARWLIEPIRKE